MTEQTIIRAALWPEDAGVLRALRETVFVQEQGVPADIEWDGRDADSVHVLALQDGSPVGCGRLLPEGRIGRLAVLPEARGHGIGATMLKALMKEAQRRCMAQVKLHAQAHASGFYARHGFVPTGAPFMEAGIEHITMLHCLDYSTCALPLAKVPLPSPFDALSVALARAARRELCLLSPRLDKAVFERSELVDAITALLRHSRNASVRILVQDADALVRGGHRLLALSQRAQSRVQLRALAEHPDWSEQTVVLRDRSGVLSQEREQASGHYYPDDRARAAQWWLRFEALWNAAETPAAFRRLTI